MIFFVRLDQKPIFVSIVPSMFSGSPKEEFIHSLTKWMEAHADVVISKAALRVLIPIATS